MTREDIDTIDAVIQPLRREHPDLEYRVDCGFHRNARGRSIPDWQVCLWLDKSHVSIFGCGPTLDAALGELTYRIARRHGISPMVAKGDPSPAA